MRAKSRAKRTRAIRRARSARATMLILSGMGTSLGAGRGAKARAPRRAAPSTAEAWARGRTRPNGLA
eukprot:3657313-Pleurochrysis_carterae.AAC.1